MDGCHKLTRHSVHNASQPELIKSTKTASATGGQLWKEALNLALGQTRVNPALPQAPIFSSLLELTEAAFSNQTVK